MFKILSILTLTILFLMPNKANALWIKYVCNTIVTSSDGGYWHNERECTIVDSGGHERPQEQPRRIFIDGETIYRVNNRPVSKEQAKRICHDKNDRETADCVFGTELAQAGGVVACFKVIAKPPVFAACEIAVILGTAVASRECTLNGIEQRQVCDNIGNFE